MRLFHHTTEQAASLILADGFRDSQGDLVMPAGVWFSDSSAAGDRAMGRHRSTGVMLTVDLPDDVAQRYLAADFPGRWREFCVPADVINRYTPARLVSNPLAEAAKTQA